MSKQIYYIYNPDTDNFERVYPTIAGRLLSFGKILLGAILLAAIIVWIVFYFVDSPTEENLRKENSRLKSQYGVLNKRLDNTLKVMDNIRHRDDNFYRVIMQLEPRESSGLHTLSERDRRYKELSKLPDVMLVEQLKDRMTLLEHQIYDQINSFEQLQEAVQSQQEKLAHIPSIIPINIAEYTMSSGYGYRIDPIYGSSKFHEGLDFAASAGTDVFATGDGKVSFAGRKQGYGNCIDISHGYNYTTRYAHLSEILVKDGEPIKRGQLIGKVGSTGKSTGPHLHYEVRFKDEPQNPINYYFMDLTPEQYAEMIQQAEDAGHVMD